MISLGTLRQATNTEAVTRFVEESVLPGTDWNLAKVRRRSVRLEPPVAYWATYRITVGRGELLAREPAPTEEEIPDTNQESAYETAAPTEAGTVAAETAEPEWSEQRELRMAVRGLFEPDAWARYRDWVRSVYPEQPCRPLDGLGYPALFDETQHAFWFFPLDPALPSLQRAVDRDTLARLFRRDKNHILDHPARISDVRTEVARYMPEISAILRYEIETTPAAAGKAVFGKVLPGDQGANTHRVMSDLWRAARRSGGRIRVPRPIGWYPDLALYVQDSVPGEPLGSDRLAPAFLPATLHAAGALAVIHESGIDNQRRLPLEAEVGRLQRTLDQFALTNPDGYFLLRDFLAHLREAVKNTPQEEWLPTHGDFKHDQLLVHEGSFSVIDFDFFGHAETSFDLGKFCAYLIPAMPISWEHSMAAEEARRQFLARYLELRPSATVQRFPIYESCNLAGRAMTLMWVQTSGWQKAANTLLVLAMERLKTRPPRAD